MKRLSLTLILFLALMAGCASAASTTSSMPQESPPTARPSFTPIPTLTFTPIPTNTPTLSVYYSEPDKIVLDFFESACDATWSNNAYEIPCPGDPLNFSRGFILPINHASIEKYSSFEAPMLVGLAGQGNGNGSGLFGHYPAVTVEAGDIFYAMIACQGSADCDVQFALEYFDAYGTYHYENNWKIPYKRGVGPLEIRFDLSNLAGQTVEFLLVLREQGPAQEARVVWINPHIARNPFAQPLPAQ